MIFFFFMMFLQWCAAKSDCAQYPTIKCQQRLFGNELMCMRRGRVGPQLLCLYCDRCKILGCLFINRLIMSVFWQNKHISWRNKKKRETKVNFSPSKLWPVGGANRRQRAALTCSSWCRTRSDPCSCLPLASCCSSATAASAWCAATGRLAEAESPPAGPARTQSHNHGS